MADKWVRYATAKGLTASDLDTEVERYLKMGYQPYESPYYADGRWFQAMVLVDSPGGA